MEPQDPGVGWAADRGRMRASDADREQVIDALKAAFVQGRLSKSELVRRAGRALESRTYAELAGTTAGIPARGTAAPLPRQPASPARARPVNGKVIAWVVSVIILAPALGVAFFATYYGSFFILLLLGFGAATALGTPGPPGAGRHGVLAAAVNASRRRPAREAAGARQTCGCGHLAVATI